MVNLDIKLVSETDIVYYEYNDSIDNFHKLAQGETLCLNLPDNLKHVEKILIKVKNID